MPTLTFQEIGFSVVVLVVLGGIAATIYSSGQKQTNQLNLITASMTKTTSDINITLTKLNATIEYTNKEIERLSNRATVQGKELDDNTTMLAVHSDKLKRHEQRLDKLDGLAHKHTDLK